MDVKQRFLSTQTVTSHYVLYLPTDLTLLLFRENSQGYRPIKTDIQKIFIPKSNYFFVTLGRCLPGHRYPRLSGSLALSSQLACSQKHLNQCPSVKLVKTVALLCIRLCFSYCYMTKNSTSLAKENLKSSEETQNLTREFGCQNSDQHYAICTRSRTGRLIGQKARGGNGMEILSGRVYQFFLAQVDQ